jgi:dTDP-4-amino-4,6-dideoxygalactose transaminase
MIPHSRPTLGEEEIDEVARVMRSGQIAQGREVTAFEEEFASFLGTPDAVAVSSGSAALHLSLLALGVGPGLQVALPSYVCSALLNAVKLSGAEPLLIDIDPRTFNIHSEDLRRRLTDETGAIIVPHMFGLPADLDEIMRLGLPVIEDCAQAVGATYRGASAGSIGTISVFSFYATKMLATGEGGLIASNNTDLLDKVRDMREYDQKADYTLRFNYKMTDLQAAMGRVQLRKLGGFLDRRGEIARIYDDFVHNTPLQSPVMGDNRTHAFYRYVVRASNDAGAILNKLRANGVAAARPVYKPLHDCLGQSGFRATDEAMRKAVSIPIYPSLSPEDVQTVARALLTAV